MYLSPKHIKFITYAVIVVLVNIAATTLYKRFDLTAGNFFSISDISKTVVGTLSEPLTINVFFTKNLPAPHNNTEQYLHDLLAEYALSANRHFNYRFYDVSPDLGDLSPKAMENQALANSYGIRPVQIQAVEKDEVKFQKAYMGLVIIHGDQIEKIPTIQSTDGLEYKLTTAIRKLNNKVSALLALEGRIQVTLYQSSSLDEVAPMMRLNNLTDIPGKVEAVVNRLSTRSYDKIAYKYVNPFTDANLEDVVKKHQLLQLNWPELDQGRIKAGSGIIGLVMQYGSKAVTIPLLNVIKVPIIGTQYQLVNLDGLEDVISANIDTLIDIHQNLGILEDFGSLPIISAPPSNPRGRSQARGGNFKTQVSQNYSLRGVKLTEGPLSDEFECLIIPRPQDKFSDFDLFQIDQFLMKGKSLAIIFDPLKEIQSQNQQFRMAGVNFGYQPLDSGLEKLLAHYGVTVEPSIIMDENCFYQKLPREMGGGEGPIYFAPLIKNQNIANHLPYMQNINGLIALKASPINLDHERIKSNGLTVQTLIRSSGKSWEVKEHINFDPTFIRLPNPDVERRSFDLACMIEGAFPSSFAGKPIPEKKDPGMLGAENQVQADEANKRNPEPEENASKIKGIQHVVEKGQPGKLFVLASTEMMLDSLMSSGGYRGNDIFILNILDYLNGQPEVAVMRSKLQQFRPLDDISNFERTAVKAVNIIGLPLIVIVLSLLMWYRRHSYKKQIQIQFRKIE